MALTVWATLSAHAQQLPPGQLPSPRQNPPAQPQPLSRSKVPLTPFRQQTTLPVADFRASNQRCDAALQGATMQISARLSVQPNPVRVGRATIDMLVDGVSTGPEELRVQNGAVTVSRSVSLSGASGQHEVVFVLEGTVRSAMQPFSHSCLARTQLRDTRLTPGMVAQETRIEAIIPVNDGLRPNSKLTVEIETTDGFAFQLSTRGAADNSVMRFSDTFPHAISREKIHRVRLYVDGERISGSDGWFDNGDAVYIQWLVLEGGTPGRTADRLYESGNLGFSLAPKVWWQSPIVNRRIVRDQLIEWIDAQVYTGADDLRIMTHEATWYETHSILELSALVALHNIAGTPVPAGASASAELPFGNYTERQRNSGLTGYFWPVRSQSELDRMNPRERRQFLFWSAFRIYPEHWSTSGITRTRIHPFNAHSTAYTTLNLPSGTRLSDIGRLSFNADLGRVPDSRGNLNNVLAGLIMDNDHWDYAGVVVSYKDFDGVARILYSDRLNYRITAPTRFGSNLPEQNTYVSRD
jgi:hypothetical protein